jgi:adenosine deaminase CECR1
MTDEYYTAATNFHLTWKEIVMLGRNCLEYSFAEAPLKAKMLADYDADIARFEGKFSTGDWRALLHTVKPEISGYAKRAWKFE